MAAAELGKQGAPLTGSAAPEEDLASGTSQASSSPRSIVLGESVVIPGPTEEEIFPVQHSCQFVLMVRSVSTVLAGCSLALLAWTLRRLIVDGMSFKMFATLFGLGVILGLVATAVALRVNAPLSLDLDRTGDLRTGGMWVLSLRRVHRQAVRCPVQDLSLYVETFGWCSKGTGKRPGARTCGFATSEAGTVHLSFATAGGHRELVMSASLEDPLAFFTKLRDVMAETSHPLSDTVALYVAEWSAGPADEPSQGEDGS